jgi:peroxiredoxin
MKKKLYLILSVVFIFSGNVLAQSPMLQKFVNKVASYKNISYTSVTKNDGIFGESADTIRTYQTSGVPSHNLQFELVNRSTRDIFDGSRLLSINLASKYYSVGDNYKYSGHYSHSIPLFKLTEVVDNVSKSPEKVKLLNDTLISSKRCNHLQIWERDTLINEKRLYTKYDVYLNKATSLPVYAESHMLGFIEKGDYSGEEAIRVDNSNWYYNYEFNKPQKTNRMSTVIPEGFMTVDEYNKSTSKKPQSPLYVGAKAPEWTLEDLNGTYLSDKDLNGKVIIMDFWGNCGACILAVPTISRIHAKYKNSDVVVVSICVDKGKDTAAKFANKYKLPYPVYINGKNLGKEFHVTPIPTFFIIDANGNIAKVIEGFSDGLENEITAQVEKLKH